MRVAMVDVWKVNVAVRRGFMHMRMGMRFGAIPLERVIMSMVLVMPMWMRVLERFMDVFVKVSLAEMQPEAERHQHRG